MQFMQSTTYYIKMQYIEKQYTSPFSFQNIYMLLFRYALIILFLI